MENSTREGLLIRGDELSVLESGIREPGLKLMATQLSDGPLRATSQRRAAGEMSFRLLSSNQDVALNWQTAPETLHLSLRLTGGGLSVEGKQRTNYSLLVMSSPGGGCWSGVLSASQKESSLECILPLSEARRLGLPPEFAVRGWVEMSLDPAVATLLYSQGRAAVQGGCEMSQHERQMWLERALHGLGTEQVRRRMEQPSHYQYLVCLTHHFLEGVPAGSLLQVADVAAELRVSVRTLQRAFRTVLGLGLSRFLLHRRLAFARRLIVDKRESVANAAFLSGFRHASRFASHYCRLHGSFPSETRRRVADVAQPSLGTVAPALGASAASAPCFA